MLVAIFSYFLRFFGPTEYDKYVLYDRHLSYKYGLYASLLPAVCQRAGESAAWARTDTGTHKSVPSLLTVYTVRAEE